MLHAKFQDLRTYGPGEEFFLKIFTIYGHDVHLGHVTSIMSLNLCDLDNLYKLLFSLPKEAPHNIWL